MLIIDCDSQMPGFYRKFEAASVAGLLEHIGYVHFDRGCLYGERVCDLFI